ncbi:unnamed protein product [Taenia asiatica]|uniref:Meis_PKNOX_N domain-containing protein n=1 Tax=Taenia asiatica TaxID=60517 RepID=A0A0R3WFY0_TAEAS|nr:unnamed protein product [Taenia asiatica]
MTTIPKQDPLLVSTEVKIYFNECILRMRQCKELARVPPASVDDVVINVDVQLCSGMCLSARGGANCSDDDGEVTVDSSALLFDNDLDGYLTS